MFSSFSCDKIEEAIKNFQHLPDTFTLTPAEILRELKDDVKSLLLKFEGLPCRARESWYVSMASQIKALWAVVTAVVIVLIGSALRNGH